MTVLDVLGPHRGPCAWCDNPDARHRKADVICEQYAAGASEDELIDTFNLVAARGGSAEAEVAVWKVLTRWPAESGAWRRCVTCGRLDRRTWRTLRKHGWVSVDVSTWWGGRVERQRMLTCSAACAEAALSGWLDELGLWVHDDE